MNSPTLHVFQACSDESLNTSKDLGNLVFLVQFSEAGPDLESVGKGEPRCPPPSTA